MSKLKSHFSFNKQERSGIFFLLLSIISLQIGYYFYSSFSGEVSKDTLIVDSEIQLQIDSLKRIARIRDSVKIYPFNPNFITDYKGYILGMSVDEIDRLHAFRKKNKFANTPVEFQQVTQISDALLDSISPLFKFPEWTKNKWQSTRGRSPYSGESRSSSSDPKKQRGNAGAAQNKKIEDLNSVTAEELKAINGIGEKLSARIIKFRDRLGGFLTNDQLYDVYGLEPHVADLTLEKYTVLRKPEIQKININSASAYEMSSLVYIQKQVAKSIVEYRNDNNGINSLDELENIEGFPFEKIDRIALYLSL